MTKRRLNKKNKRLAVISGLSDDNTVDGNTTQHSYTARGRTHQGGFCSDTEAVQRLSTSHRSTSHQSTRHWSTRHQGTRHPAVFHQSTWHQATGHQSSSHQLFSDYQTPSSRQLITSTGQPVTGHQSIHQVPVITHHSTDNDYPVANKTYRSSEYALPNEPQNSSASKGISLPLEPDFSQISDPSIVIALQRK